MAGALSLSPPNIENVETIAAWGELPSMVVVTREDVNSEPIVSVFEITERSGEPRIASHTVYTYFFRN